MSAAEAIRAEDPAADIAMVCAEPESYYSRPGLAYYFAKEETTDRLFPFTSQDIASLGVRTIVGRVAGIAPASHVVRLENGSELQYDRLLIATGSSAIPIGVPGAGLDGVTKLDDISDARDLVDRATHARAALVVGGGITALEIVEGLLARRVHVHYLMRRDRYWSNVLSESESHLVEDALRDHGVEIHYFTEVAEIVGRGGRVAGVTTTAGEQIACELVAVAIGVLPQKQLAEAAGLECGRGVLVDEYLRSSEPEIFAAGDVAEMLEPLSGKRTIEVLWSSAVAKGRVAGHNMASDEGRPYQKGAPLNVTRLGGFKTTIIGRVGTGHDSDLEGIARGDSETWRRLGEGSTVEWNGPDTHVRLALARADGDSVTIIGAIVMGDQEVSFPLQDLIVERADVSAIAERLAEPHAVLPDLIDDFWRKWQAQRV